MNCIFCDMVSGKIPSHRIWEDEGHLAFLSIYPNTPGFTVVIPKKHYSSYIFDQENDVIAKLMIASKKASSILMGYYQNVGRVGVIFEGYGVDHLHSKLFPMHGTGSSSEFKKISSSNAKFFYKYEGYISSHDHARVEDSELAVLARKIRASRTLSTDH